MSDEAPITGPACTVAVLAAALTDVDPDTPIVLQIPGYPWLWRIGDIRLTAFSEHHRVDETTIVLPQIYVVVEADKVIRCDMSVAGDATPDAAQPHGLLRRLLRRCRYPRKRPQ